MAYLPLVGAPLTALGYYLDTSLSLKLAKHYFSEEFGHENRVKYLNYIRTQDGGKPGCYEKTVEYLVEHPVMARRLVVTTEIAIRAVEVSGALMCASAAIAALGVTGTPALIMTCVALSPLVTKVLAEQWPSLECVDGKLNGMVLVASTIYAIIGIFPFEFMDHELLGRLAFFDVLIPTGYVGFDHLIERSVDVKESWENFLKLQKLEQDLKDKSKGIDVDRAVQDLKLTPDWDLKWPLLLDMKRKLQKEYLNLQIKEKFAGIKREVLTLGLRIQDPKFAENKEEIVSVAEGLKKLLNDKFKKYCEANVELSKMAAESNRYSAGALKAMKDQFANESTGLVAIIVGISKMFLEKGQDPYKKYHDELGQIDPKANPYKFLQTYKTCLALLDPLEATQASKEFVRDRTGMSLELLNFSSNDKLDALLKMPIGMIGTDELKIRAFQREFGDKLAIACSKNRRDLDSI